MGEDEEWCELVFLFDAVTLAIQDRIIAKS